MYIIKIMRMVNFLSYKEEELEEAALYG